jgi:class 3 adenylate cyclase/tetratricopeptide (TPR) repeat protein
MKCSKCGHENRAGAKFCEECGGRLAAVCGHCGAELSPVAKFCSECGQPINQPTSASSPRFAAPEAYTPKHLAEKILTSRASIEGERKQVTALFADLKSSMELFADRDPEEVRKILDPVLDHMMEAVHRFEGTVNHVLGDGIMALFGAPLAHEDAAVRACYAALRMQETVKRYAEGVRRSEGIPIQIRVGLNSGEVVVRSIGSDLKMDYTVVGQTMNVAARMEQMATPGTILISADTLAMAEGYVLVKPLGAMTVKGLDHPLEVFEVTGAGTARSRMEASAARGLTPFVGREAELDALNRALDKARGGKGQLVALVGEPGVGKSRLFWEFIHSHRTHGWLVLEGGTASYSKSTVYLPVIDLLKGYFQIEPRDEPRKIREKITGKILSLDRALEPSLPAFLTLLDVPADDPHWQSLDPPTRRQRTLDALKRLLIRESQIQPLGLALEDLHWIDSETQGLLDSLVDSMASASLLLIVNYRPEYQHTWGGKSYYTQLRIDPLPPQSCEDMLHGLLGADESLRGLKQHLIAQTQGNPFYLEESIRTLAETHVLAGERGSYRLAKPLSGVQVPATVQAILAARIDRLPAEEKRLLQAAAVIGVDVPFSLLEAIAEQPGDALQRGLAHLQAAEFLYQARLFPEVEYTFRHGLTYEVAYGSLLHERQQALHARIVEAIEWLHSERLAEQVERLAYHAVRGRLWDKAARYLSRAGARALDRSAHREAVPYFEQALAALTHLPETRETREQSIDLRLGLRNSLFPLGEIDAVIGHLRDAERVASALDDRLRLARVLVATSHHFLVTGDAEEARRFGNRAFDISETLGDRSLQVSTNLYLGAAFVSLGEFQRAGECLGRTTRLLEGDLVRERFGLHGFPAAIARSYLAWLLAEQGEFAEATALGQEGVAIAEAAHHAYSHAYASWGLAYSHVARGDLVEAERVLERAATLVREWNLPLIGALVSGLIGLVRARSERAADGVELLRDAVASYERSFGRGIWHSLNVTWLGEALLRAKRPDDARAAADRALALARELNHRVCEPWALWTLGELACRESADSAAAEHCYGQALARAEALGMRPLAAQCHAGLGKICHRAGDGEKAREHFATATTMSREMRLQTSLLDDGAEPRQRDQAD